MFLVSVFFFQFIGTFWHGSVVIRLCNENHGLEKRHVRKLMVSKYAAFVSLWYERVCNFFLIFSLGKSDMLLKLCLFSVWHVFYFSYFSENLGNICLNYCNTILL